MPITFSDTHFWIATYRSGIQVSEYDCTRQNVDYANLDMFIIRPKKPDFPEVVVIKPDDGYRLFYAARRFGDLDIATGIERDEGTDYEIGVVADDGRPVLDDMERGGVWPHLNFSKGFWAVLPRAGELYLRAGKAKITQIGNKYLLEVD